MFKVVREYENVENRWNSTQGNKYKSRLKQILQWCGEYFDLEQLECEDDELTDFVSTAKGVLQSLVENIFQLLIALELIDYLDLLINQCLKE